MTDAFFTVQQAVFNALSGNATIQSFLGATPRIYDHVPPGAAFPYAVFGPVSANPYDTKTETGFQQVVTIEIWSRYRGTKEAKDILQAIYDVLHRGNLTVSGHVFLSCEFHNVDITPESDGLTTHASARYVIVTQAT